MRHHTVARPLRGTLACLLGGAVLVAACGAPGRVETLDRSGDFGRVATALPHTLPRGLSDVGVDGPRLVAACTARETRAAAPVPDIGANGAHDAVRFVGRHCEWSGSRGPALVVGMIDDSGAASDLDETVLFIDHERSIARVGARAVYDPDTVRQFTSSSATGSGTCSSWAWRPPIRRHSSSSSRSAAISRAYPRRADSHQPSGTRSTTSRPPV